ncbi:MAG: NRDE family protein [Solirubrobacterales bacterium]
MCLIFLACNCHPRYPLVVAANRDEFYARADLPAAYWPDQPDLLAGKDLEQGGTWMGITAAGRFAALTNYRDPARFNPNASSRGHLVQRYLAGADDPEAYLAGIPDGGRAYNGFSLLAGSDQALFYYSNRENRIRRLERGIHGLSNSLINIPWPKVTRGVQAISDCLSSAEPGAEALFEIMANRECPVDQDLPETGVGLEMERMLGPIFVVSPNYGTKSTTIMMVDRERRVRFWERTFEPGQPELWNQVYYEFVIEQTNPGHRL